MSTIAPSLTIPPEWIDTLQAEGWTYRGANAYYVFFDRAGHWLRLSKPWDTWTASVLPEPYRVPVGGEYGQAWPDDQRAPVYRGKGAATQAREAARVLWRDTLRYLTPMSVHLANVGVMQWRGSGAGGYDAPRIYHEADLG